MGTFLSGKSKRILTALFLFAVMFFIGFPPNVSFSNIQAKNDQSVSDSQVPYNQWINEDVIYIIKAEERDVFRSLKSDEEREQFIIQFWERRNPAPGAPENSFKTEHYRRLAYSNQNFASRIPGWKTDRGRVYILYGEPDNKETNSDTQRWHYRHLDALGDNIVFEFIRSTPTGDFILKTERTIGSPLKK